MGEHSRTVLYLDRMQLDWLPQGQRWIPRQGTRVVAGIAGLLFIRLGGALGFGLATGIRYKVGSGYSFRHQRLQEYFAALHDPSLDKP
jgi:hypothetical protein